MKRFLAPFLIPVVASALVPGTDADGASEQLASLARLHSNLAAAGGGRASRAGKTRRRGRALGSEVDAGKLCQEASPVNSKAFCDVEMDLTAIESMLPPGTSLIFCSHLMLSKKKKRASAT